MVKQGPLSLFLPIFTNFFAESFALTCSQKVPSPTWAPIWRLYTIYVECDDFFEVCCDRGCCDRFTQTHIWLIVSCLSFALFLCLFGLWYCCCKNTLRSRPGQNVRNGERGSTLLTRTLSQNGSENSNDSHLTPPPSYGLTLADYNPSAPSLANQINTTITDSGAASDSVTNRSGTGFITPPPSYEEAIAKK